jgi:hypothetical protein
MDEAKVKVLLALGIADEEFFAAVRTRAEEVIEEYRARAGDPDCEPGKAHALACMSTAVDDFLAELEAGREAGLKLKAGGNPEDDDG